MTDIKYTQDDRDRMVRMETKQEHLTDTVDDIDRRLAAQIELSRQNADVARENTISIRSFTDWMKEHKDVVRTQESHEVRLAVLEDEMKSVKGTVGDLKDLVGKALFLGKIGYGILTTPILIYIGLQVFTFLHSAK